MRVLIVEDEQELADSIALGLGAGGSWRSPMAITVIGGIITSTLLTLVVVPVAYSILEKIRKSPVVEFEEDLDKED